MQHTPRPQEIYRHFKGNLYQVITVAEHSETGEQLVIYQAMYGRFQTYARPLAMFLEKVDRTKYPNALQEYRFEVMDMGENPAGSAVDASIDYPQADDSGRNIRADRADGMPGIKTGSVSNDVPDGREEGYGGASKEKSDSGKGKYTAREEACSGIEQEAEELNMDPMVLEFLDASAYRDRLDILSGLHHRITDDMINIMAMATDIEVKPGDVEDRYVELRSCLLKLEKYECNRLRQHCGGRDLE